MCGNVCVCVLAVVMCVCGNVCVAVCVRGVCCRGDGGRS